MKTLRILLAAALTSSALTMSAANGINNPMTRAVLDAYEKLLKEDPTDYETWLNRANEYYRQNEYMRALNDVDNALKYIPSNDKDTRCIALMLRANIYTQTNRTNDALTDLNSVIALDPDHYVAIYQRANAYYTLGEYASAKNDFTHLQRLNPRSSEALVGLARVAAKEDNLGLVSDYLEQAVAANPGNTDLYVRRATVRRDLGDHNGAVDDLILAIATDTHNSRAIDLLVEYGKVNYPVVINGLTKAIDQAPSIAIYPYLRAVIAQYNNHYKAALADYQSIIDKNLNNYQGIYRSMAECQFAMGQYDEALANVDRALEMDRNAGDAALLRARILRTLGRYDEAKDQAEKAIAMLPGNVNALNELGLVYMSLKQYKNAADVFGEATMSTDDPTLLQQSYMFRAWVLGTYLNQPVAAKGFYDKAYSVYDETENLPATNKMYAAFARRYTDCQAEGDVLAELTLNENSADAGIQYIGACYYAQAGDNDRALECAKRALDAGYANFHDWNNNADGLVNVEPLRVELRFLNLLEKYSHLWK